MFTALVKPGAKRRLLVLLASAFALPLAVVACRHPPDPTAVRAGLVADAITVCQAPPARPPHATLAADAGPPPTPAAIDSAAREICVHDALSAGPNAMQLCSPRFAPSEACRAELVASEPAMSVIHAALLEDHAVVGDVRRTTMFFGPSIDTKALERLEPAALSSANKVIASMDAERRSSCYPDRLHVERMMLVDAEERLGQGHADDALNRCADVAALARDAYLTGDLIDMSMGDTATELLETTCTPIVAAASPTAAHAFAASMRIVRAACPAFDPVLVRDAAEMHLRTFAAARDPAMTFPCLRAEKLAAAGGPPSADPEVLRAAAEAWRQLQDAAAPDASKYRDVYILALARLDSLIALAAAR